MEHFRLWQAVAEKLQPHKAAEAVSLADFLEDCFK